MNALPLSCFSSQPPRTGLHSQTHSHIPDTTIVSFPLSIRPYKPAHFMSVPVMAVLGCIPPCLSASEQSSEARINISTPVLGWMPPVIWRPPHRPAQPLNSLPPARPPPFQNCCSRCIALSPSKMSVPIPSFAKQRPPHGVSLTPLPSRKALPLTPPKPINP